MRFSRSTRLLMLLSLETLMSIIRTGLPILVELIDVANSVIICLSQMTLLRWLTFLVGSQTVILIVLFCWIYFCLLMLVFVLQWLSLHLESLIMLLSQFPLTFHKIHNGMPHFITWLFLCWLEWSCDHLRDVPWEILHIFKLGVCSAAASEYCEWVQVGIDVYIPLSMVFSCLCCCHSS